MLQDRQSKRNRRPHRLMWILLISSAIVLFWGGAGAQEEPAAHGNESHAVEVADGHGHEADAHGEDASHGAAGHADPVAGVLLQIVIILLLARIAGHVAEAVGQPAVLGELLIGVGLGAFALLAPDLVPGQLIADARTEGSHIDIIARIGVILLLFEVGLESSFIELMKVGWPSLIVAITGVVAPFAMGFFATEFLVTTFPAGMEPYKVGLFLGATLAATSVGITARVIKDLNKLDVKESKIILGAAVIDDVLGLIILAVVSGIVVASGAPGGGEDLNVMHLAGVVTLKAGLFLIAAVIFGQKCLPFVFRMIRKLRGAKLDLVFSLAFCFLMAYLANAVGLATIVGAFAAGLVIESETLKPFSMSEHFEGAVHALREKVSSFAAIFVPVFFVQMGLQVRLETFLQKEILVLALGLTIAAIIGKLLCGVTMKGGFWSRATVGIGMVPRGEVGLIFANIGLALGVVDTGTFSAIVIMVVLTTFMTPPLLKVCLARIPSPEPPPRII